MPSIDQVRNLSAGARLNLWEVLIPRIPAATDNTVVQDVTLRARNAQFPGMTIESVMSYFKGHPIPHPARRDYTRPLRYRFEEGLNLSIMNAMTAWFNVFRDEETGLGEGEEAFKVDIFVRLLDDSDNVIGQAHLHNAYPEEMSPLDLDYASIDLLHLDVAFNYSHWTFE